MNTIAYHLVLLITTVVIFLISYSIISYMLEHYIFRKIKLIYKIIHESKTSVRNKYDVISDKNILNRVGDEVAKWAKSQEEEIASLKKMEEYRRNFIGDISHELKTPIFAIQGYVHTLIDGGIEDDTINKKYLDRTANNIERLARVVDDLEVISKLEREKYGLDLKDFNIKTLVNEVFDDCRLRAKERDISLNYKSGADQGWIVTADYEMIRQVLDNLLTNSIKYGVTKGTTSVGFYDMHSYLLVEVSDNGIGISDDHLNHLFDRFYRVDKSRSRTIGGSGLGLAIAKHIMEAHKQTINVRSTKGQGSTFSFTLKKKQ